MRLLDKYVKIDWKHFGAHTHVIRDDPQVWHGQVGEDPRWRPWKPLELQDVNKILRENYIPVLVEQMNSPLLDLLNRQIDFNAKSPKYGPPKPEWYVLEFDELFPNWYMPVGYIRDDIIKLMDRIAEDAGYEQW
jgi:hypothetical protein